MELMPRNTRTGFLLRQEYIFMAYAVDNAKNLFDNKGRLIGMMSQTLQA